MIFRDKWVLHCSAADNVEELIFLKYCLVTKVIAEFGKISGFYTVEFSSAEDFMLFKTGVAVYLKEFYKPKTE